ncbi:MAG: mug [Acidimicrobiales bacterium]|nr:mug [Acidimicrobiales bacterium]
MHRETVDVYEQAARHYAEHRSVHRADHVAAFAAAVRPDGPRLDLGAGPGHYLPLLGRPAVALDAARAMIVEARRQHGDVPGLQGDLVHLPFRGGAFAGVWASKSLQHLPAGALPGALAEVHRVLEVGGRFDLTVFEGDGAAISGDESDLPGRLFTWWRPDALADLLEGAGFAVQRVDRVAGEDGFAALILSATRLRSLPDHVAPGMRLLCCGLNPSLRAADAGVGYVTPGNRFWPAVLAAGLATVDRDPRHLLAAHGVGMTDLVKRASPRAAELRAHEHRAGIERLRRLCAWLQPGALCVVGLAGWRAAVDRGAVVGWQPERLGGVPVYVMPSTSGLNARTPLAELTAHLRSAAAPDAVLA